MEGQQSLVGAEGPQSLVGIEVGKGAEAEGEGEEGTFVTADC
jgi:hypothetical protein